MTSGDGTELLKITDKVADLMHKLAGPMAEEIGLMLGDKVKVYRVKNWIKTAQRAEALLREAGLPVNAVPPRLLLPIIESCSVEDNETLQKLWAGLLATASKQADRVSPSFIETLKQLTPDEARHLEKLFKERNGLDGNRTISPYAFASQNGAPAGAGDNFERLGIVRRDYVASFNAATHSDGIIESVEDAMNAVGVDVGYFLKWTDYAIKFWIACHGPRKARAKQE